MFIVITSSLLAIVSFIITVYYLLMEKKVRQSNEKLARRYQRFAKLYALVFIIAAMIALTQSVMVFGNSW